jgi:hypothetical protein
MEDIIKNVLISKSTLLFWIRQALNGLENPVDKSDDYWRNIHDLNAIINESDCCIDHCSDLERLYRWLLCTLRRSLEWLETETYHKVNDWISQLNGAWLAMESIVIEESKGRDVHYVLSELGFIGKTSKGKE